MEKSSSITETKNVSTRKAATLIAFYHWCIIKNIARGINKSVYRFPWVYIVAVIVISFILSFIFISKARAERDSYNQTLVNTQMKLKSYQALTDK